MKWFEINNIENILTPALVLYPERIEHNIEKMIEIAGSKDKLRPHVKTYKMPQIVKMQMARGINKFKCSTLVEARMLAQAGVSDILIAMPLIGPSQKVFISLMDEYKDIQFSTLIDNSDQLLKWKEKLKPAQKLDFYIDINVGMDRTGIIPANALSLVKNIQDEERFRLQGLHVYDGHIRISDLDKRNAKCDKDFEPVFHLIENIPNGKELEIVCGGSVTFPCHAQYEYRTLSPGTTLLWDAGYGTNFTDIPMQNAAMLVTRIISKPSADLICLDLGHKAVASEMQGKRVLFPQIENYERVGHSEEHLVLHVDNPEDFEIGQVLYGIPWHICPTVALHREALIIRQNQLVDHWKVTARHREYQA